MFVHCAHQLWPYHLNDPFSRGKNGPRGALLHLKFLAKFVSDLSDPVQLKHRNPERRSYRLSDDMIIWTEASHEYKGWTSLLEDGLVINL
jgi:hypothetical protein